MPLATTVIGAWPKPSFLDLPDWFNVGPNMNSYDIKEMSAALDKLGKDDMEKQVEKAMKEVIDKQTRIGIDVITDGEMRRDTYYLHFCRNLNGIDFDNLVDKTMRSGAYVTKVPQISGPISLKVKGLCTKEWLSSQNLTDKILKFTIPGPMTIMDGMIDNFYGPEDRRRLIEDLIAAINAECLELEKAGCKVIQIDEPVMMRYPEVALDYGLDDVIKCLTGLGDGVTKVVHFCCGYPEKVDDDEYMKADKKHYRDLAKRINGSIIDQVSIEDAEARNDLSLLKEFGSTTVILGVVTVARSKIESVEEISERVEEALKYISKDQLILAPDCGLGFLNEDQIEAKLKNMVAAAKKF